MAIVPTSWATYQALSTALDTGVQESFNPAEPHLLVTKQAIALFYCLQEKFLVKGLIYFFQDLHTIFDENDICIRIIQRIWKIVGRFVQRLILKIKQDYYLMD